MGWGHYLFGFSGRINRAKMWASYLVLFAAEFPILAVVVAVGPDRLDEFAHAPPWSIGATAGAAVLCLVALAVEWFMLAVIVKRLHDRNKSAWWLLLFAGGPYAFMAALGLADTMLVTDTLPRSAQALIATAALIVAAVIFWFFAELFLLKGTEGPNRFGPDPLHSL